MLGKQKFFVYVINWEPTLQRRKVLVEAGEKGHLLALGQVEQGLTVALRPQKLSAL